MLENLKCAKTCFNTQNMLYTGNEYFWHPYSWYCSNLWSVQDCWPHRSFPQSTSLMRMRMEWVGVSLIGQNGLLVVGVHQLVLEGGANSFGLALNVKCRTPNPCLAVSSPWSLSLSLSSTYTPMWAEGPTMKQSPVGVRLNVWDKVHSSSFSTFFFSSMGQFTIVARFSHDEQGVFAGLAWIIAILAERLLRLLLFTHSHGTGLYDYCY